MTWQKTQIYITTNHPYSWPLAQDQFEHVHSHHGGFILDINETGSVETRRWEVRIKWIRNKTPNNSTTNNQPTQLLTTQSPNVDTRPDFRQVLLSPLPTLVSGDFKTGDAVDYQVDRSFLPWCVGGSRRRWWCGRHHSRGQQTAQDFKWLVVRYLV